MSLPSRFLKEVPGALVRKVSAASAVPAGRVDLYAEQHAVRETVRKNLYTGKTFNSVENIRQFFENRASGALPPQAPPASAPLPAQGKAPAAVPAKSRKVGRGSAIEHPKFGRGTIVMMEGSGEDTKITVSFPGHGLKKMVAKYAGIKIE